MPLKGKYLKYQPEITFDIFKLVWDRLLELGWRENSNSSIKSRWVEFTGKYPYFRHTIEKEFNTHEDSEGRIETTVQEILGYNPFVKESTEKWFIGSYVVPLQNRLLTRDEPLTAFKPYIITRGSIPYINCDNGCEINFCVNKCDAEKIEGIKWFATKSEAEEFAKTLVEEVKEEVKTPQLDLNEWLNKYKKLNLAVNDLANAIELSNFDKVFLKLEGTNSKEKANILYDLWNPKQPLRQAVHCKTQEEWDFVTEKLNYKWIGSDWYGEDCYINTLEKETANKSWWLSRGYQLLSFQEWCDLNGYKMENEVKFEVGDYVILRGNGVGNGVCEDEIVTQLLDLNNKNTGGGNINPDFNFKYKNYIFGTKSKYIIRHATPEEINNHLISIRQIPAGEPLNTGIEPNKSNTYQAISIQRDPNPQCTFNSIKINGQEILKPKMILSIDNEELPMVNIIKTNTIKQLLNND